MMKALYTATVTAKGGRDGHATSTDGMLDIDLSTPKELGGQGGATNPEQLFAAAWGPCFLGALGSVAKKDGVDVENATITVNITFNEDGNAYALSAAIDVHIPEIGIEEAQKLVKKAHLGCPYSKATRGNVETTVNAI